MKKQMITVLVLSWIGFIAHAEVITLPVGQQTAANADIERPERGQTKAQVEAAYGAPRAMVDPVGDPPITSWEYADFTVFFEYDLVLHSVLKHQPKNPL